MVSTRRLPSRWQCRSVLGSFSMKSSVRGAHLGNISIDMDHSKEFVALVDDAKCARARITIDDVAARRGDGARLIDVREDDEFRAGHAARRRAHRARASSSATSSPRCPTRTSRADLVLRRRLPLGARRRRHRQDGLPARHVAHRRLARMERPRSPRRALSYSSLPGGTRSIILASALASLLRRLYSARATASVFASAVQTRTSSLSSSRS